MSKESKAMSVSPLLVVSGVQPADLDILPVYDHLTASEFYVLQRLRQFKLRTALRRPNAPLTSEMRQARIEGLMTLWNTGCPKAIDEDLYADLERRARQVLQGSAAAR